MNEKKKEGNCLSFRDLLAMLASPDGFDRAEAAKQLCNLGKEASNAGPAIPNLNNDPSYLVRIQVPRAVIHFEIQSQEALNILDRLVNDENEIVKEYAKEARTVMVERKK